MMLHRYTQKQIIITLRQLNMGRVVPELDHELAEKISDKTINPKKLVTRRNHGLIRLPAKLHFAAELKIKQIADRFFRREVKYLNDTLYKMQLPDDEVTIKRKRNDIKTEMILRDKIPEYADYDPTQYHLTEEMIIARDQLRQAIEGKLEGKRRDWHYYEYDEFASVLYMATRMAPNYASLRTILNEISDNYPNFRPQSVLDFGSGAGSTMWAINETWPDDVKEFLNIDLSIEQQHLSEFLLRGGKEFGNPLPNVYYRQYLPASTQDRYDIVVSAFSLLELNTIQMRTQVLETLWQKTKDMLIIVERGNHDGFTAVLEARQLILDLSGHGVTKRLAHHPEIKPRANLKFPQSHIVSPCPHEFSCPRLTFSSKLNLNTCNFKLAFEPLNIGSNKGPNCHDTFSYVVIRKGPHPSYTCPSYNKPRWPRVIAPRIRGSSHVRQKLCCANGDIAEIIVTKSKYGKEMHEVAKSVNWGDVLPIKVTDDYLERRMNKPDD